jgi:hypothetical protein
MYDMKNLAKLKLIDTSAPEGLFAPVRRSRTHAVKASEQYPQRVSLFDRSGYPGLPAL